MVVTSPGFDHQIRGTPARAWREHASWGAGAPLSFDGVDRLIVVGAHPDDESLGAGALTARAVRLGLEVELVCLTDGERSHPGSPTHTPQDLAARRREEAVQASRALGVQRVHQLGRPDGLLSGEVDEIVRFLVDLLGDARRTVVAAPWRKDGHPDHEAAGHAAATACRRTGARLWEYPIWFWHWAAPEDAPWTSFSCVPVSIEAGRAKQEAIMAHASQVSPLSELAGDEVLLDAWMLAHFADGPEHIIASDPTALPDDDLEQLHAREQDPWGTDTRWYEHRKRALVLAALPRARFRSTLELGCSTGALAHSLAGRSEQTVAVDRSPSALDAARRRLTEVPGATAVQLDVPEEWPTGVFDLVVVSELGYFLSPQALDALVRRVHGSLSDDGTVVLCHWRHPVEGWVLDAAAVHRAFEQADELPPVQARVVERDFEIVVLAPQDTWPESTR